MVYRYKCKEHGEFDLSHSMSADRDSQVCPQCSSVVEPLISFGVGMKLTGRPPWAYNDALRVTNSLDKCENNQRTGISPDTTVTDKREGSKTFGKKMKLNKNMGGYNAQW